MVKIGYLLFVSLLFDGQDVKANPYLDLYSNLLQSYKPEIIPRCTTDTNVSVSVSTALRQILDVNELEQTVYLKLWMRLTWIDCFLKWNVSEYNNISSISLNAANIWTPDIVLYESVSEDLSLPEERGLRVVVTNEGRVTYNFPSAILISCSIDVTYFPYDTQNCSLRFSSWTQPGHVVDVVHISSGDLSSFLENNEWTIRSMESRRQVVYFKCCQRPHSLITYHLVISRKPKFYIVTLLLPCVFILALAALGLILPSESGEKMSLQITVLLSLAVYLLIISERLPAASEKFPLLGMYVTVTMALVTTSCLLSMFVLYIYFQDSSAKRVPKLLRKCCLGLNCLQSKEASYKISHTEEKHGDDKIPLKHINIGSQQEQYMPSSDRETNGEPCIRTLVSKTEHDKRREWHRIASFIDKILLLVFSAISTIITVIFILVLKGHE